MSSVIGSLSLSLEDEVQNGSDSTTLVFSGEPGSTHSVDLWRMDPAGPTNMLSAPTLVLNADGIHLFPLFSKWPAGLYVGRAVQAGAATPQNDSMPRPFWIGPDEPADLSNAVEAAQRDQTAWREREIVAADYTGTDVRRLMVVIEGCRLDYQQRIEGGHLSPLGEMGAESLLAAVHSVVPPEIRFTDTAELQASYGREHPMCLVTFANVRAPDHGSCVVAVQKRLRRVLAALAENRSCSPKAVAYVSQSPSEWRLSVVSGIYRGNLVPGFGPGVTGALQRYEEAIQADPWIEFALELMREARGHSEGDLLLFSCWVLIEAAAKRTIPPSPAVVNDDTGQPLPGRGGKALTLQTDLGRVIVYLRDHVGRNLLGFGLNSSPDFYDSVRLAYICRNRIAHEGGIAVPTSAVPAGYTPFLPFTVRGWAETVIQHEVSRALGVT